MHWAAKRGFHDIVELLLAYDIEVEAKDFVRHIDKLIDIIVWENSITNGRKESS